MDVDRGELESVIRQVGNKVSPSTLVAAGGTALTLHDIKQTTDDMDFIVDSGDMGNLSLEFSRAASVKIDLFGKGMCFWNPLPADYLSKSMFVNEFGNIRLYALSITDVILTKTARSDSGDIEDIRACKNSVNWKEIVERYSSYRGVYGLREKLVDVLINVFDVSGDDIR